jgi:hypothetical protein
MMTVLRTRYAVGPLNVVVRVAGDRSLDRPRALAGAHGGSREIPAYISQLDGVDTTRTGDEMTSITAPTSPIRLGLNALGFALLAIAVALEVPVARADSTPIGTLPRGPVSTITTTPGQLVAVALPRAVTSAPDISKLNCSVHVWAWFRRRKTERQT